MKHRTPRPVRWFLLRAAELPLPAGRAALPLRGLGGVILLFALFAAFYLRTEEIWLVPEDGIWRVYGRSRKGSELFREKLAQKIKEVSK